MAKKKRGDVNLPDDKKGQIVGEMDVAELKDSKGRKFRFSKPIRGGDPDDPRWDEHRERVKKFAGVGAGSRVLRDDDEPKKKKRN